MTPTEKEQLWNSIMKMRSMPWKGPRGGTYNWTQREMRQLFDKLVVYGDTNQPTAAWRLLNSGKYKYMIYPWNKKHIYDEITFGPPPVPKSMWWGTLQDISGGGFSNFPTDWVLEGDILPNANITIINPPYSGNGNAGQVFDPYDPYCLGCLFRIYTIEDIGFTMPTWNGTDNNGTPISVSFHEISTKKSFSGNITPTPGTNTIIYFEMLDPSEFSDASNFPQDLTDPNVSTYMTGIFRILFGTQASVTVTVNGVDDYTITVSDIYSTSSNIGFKMSDGLTYYIYEV
jgi:hypothetical protein